MKNTTKARPLYQGLNAWANRDSVRAKLNQISYCARLCPHFPDEMLPGKSGWAPVGLCGIDFRIYHIYY
jgi:hypothetical protein